jgi:LmbE family N-acetylglucosaminyl deacetylase
MATVVAFHAHPDDEVLLTGGTLALLAAQGHRTVVVVACDGIIGAATGPDGQRRMDELRASARVLGVARVAHLGYADSGHGPLLYADPPDRPRFVRASVDEAARRLADILREEHADLLIGYDAQGQYGHRDHVHVHHVALRAARLAGTPRVMQATVPREPFVRVNRLLRLARMNRTPAYPTFKAFGSPRAEITHRIDVRAFADTKRRALTCHTSQLSGRTRMGRLARVLVRLPAPIIGLVLGREWFVAVSPATLSSARGQDGP